MWVNVLPTLRNIHIMSLNPSLLFVKYDDETISLECYSSLKTIFVKIKKKSAYLPIDKRKIRKFFCM